MSLNLFLGRAKSFLLSVLSRVLARAGLRQRVSDEARFARVLSCNGFPGELPPCEFRAPSARHPGSHFCGACGCGDRQSVLVAGELPAYEKLAYPYLVCPASMPGFSNYRAPVVGRPMNPRMLYLEERFAVDRLVAFTEEQGRGFRLQLLLRQAARAWHGPVVAARRVRIWVLRSRS
jgi:hypothetical protein